MFLKVKELFLYGQMGMAAITWTIATAMDTRQVYTHYLWVPLALEVSARFTTKIVLLPWLSFILGMSVQAREKDMPIS